jgi:hypothetical protein
MGCSNSITRASLIKARKTSISFSLADFQQSSSISVMAEIIGYSLCSKLSINFSASIGYCCCK